MYKFVFVIFSIISLSFKSVISGDHYIWGSLKSKEPSMIETSLVRELDTMKVGNDVGVPLILTPYIKRGNICLARTLSRVKPQMGSWSSYSGYFTVNDDCGDNLFFWFVPAKNNWLSAPVLLWLQGGPGAGSLYGLFEEIGPFNHFTTGLKDRKYTWNTNNNIIYIDQPVGSGYSFSKINCFAQNMTTVTEELYSALVQFFELFPELQKNRFFLTGESFAGHYIPALGQHIHLTNPTAEVKINLAGILIGNPLAMLSCHDYATFLYEWGVVGGELRKEINERQDMLKAHSKSGQYKEAWGDWDYILNNLIGERTYLPDRECMVNIPHDQGDYITWVASPAVRKQIHVGNIEYRDINWEVYKNLIDTIAQPMTSELELLLEAKSYSIGFYSGNLDMICLTTSTECILSGLHWWGSQDFLQAVRKPFTVDGDSVAGWVKTAGPLYLVVVKDSGHTVPAYQPNVTLTLINAVTSAAPGVNPGTLLKT